MSTGQGRPAQEMTDMPMFERVMLMPFEIKSFSAETGEVVGLASTPQVDRMGEIVSSEAMREAAERYMRNPIITWQHNTDDPIGRGLEVYEKCAEQMESALKERIDEVL